MGIGSPGAVPTSISCGSALAGKGSLLDIFTASVVSSCFLNFFTSGRSARLFGARVPLGFSSLGGQLILYSTLPRVRERRVVFPLSRGGLWFVKELPYPSIGCFSVVVLHKVS